MRYSIVNMGGNDIGLNSANILAYYVECKAEKVGVKSNISPMRNVYKNEVTDAVIELCEDFEKRYANCFGELFKECASKNLTQGGYWSTLSELLDKNLNWGRIDRLLDRNFHKNKVTDAVVELCEEFEDRNAKSIGELCKECASNNISQESYWNILSKLLDQDLNWDRIIAIFAFAGALSLDRMRSNCHGDIENIQDWTYKFMKKHVELWVEKNNGWNGLVEFHNIAVENGMQNDMNPVSTRYIVADYLNNILCKHNLEWRSCPPLGVINKVHSAMRNLTDEFEKEYELQQQHVRVDLAYENFFAVAESLFTEGRISWGRVVGLFSFGGLLAVECMVKQMEYLVDSIYEWVSTYVQDKLSQWITENGGWNGLAEFYDQAAEKKKKRQKWLEMVCVGRRSSDPWSNHHPEVITDL